MKTWFIYKATSNNRWHVKKMQEPGDMTIQVVEKKHLEQALAEIEKLKAKMLVQGAK